MLRVFPARLLWHFRAPCSVLHAPHCVWLPLVLSTFADDAVGVSFCFWACIAAAAPTLSDSGRLPRNLPALRAMEMALRTNSFATPTTANEGGGEQDMDEADDSDSEMEYMIPLHTASKRGMPRIFNSSQLRTFWQWAKFVTA
ncbi:hypothetical protein ACLKA7_010863 [Drosophila subpalustris]